jgi:hypothetical protein
MKKYRIIKKYPNVIGDFILLHPTVENDEIYEFDSIEEAQNKLEEIKEWLIYENIELIIVEIDYPQ